MIRLFRPHRIIEVGSGFSSAVMLDTNERFMNREHALDVHRTQECPPTQAAKRGGLQRHDRSWSSRSSASILASSTRLPQTTYCSSIPHTCRMAATLTTSSSSLAKTDDRSARPLSMTSFTRLSTPRTAWRRDSRGMSSYLFRAFLQYNTQFSIKFWNDFMIRFHQSRYGS